jgi:hypothetical protein
MKLILMAEWKDDIDITMPMSRVKAANEKHF